MVDAHSVLLAKVKEAEAALKKKSGPEQQAQLRQLMVLRVRIQGLQAETSARLALAQERQRAAQGELAGIQELRRRSESTGLGETDGDSDADSDSDSSVVPEAYFRQHAPPPRVEDRPVYRMGRRPLVVEQPVAPAGFRSGQSIEVLECPSKPYGDEAPKRAFVLRTPSPPWAYAGAFELPFPSFHGKGTPVLSQASPDLDFARRLSFPMRKAPASPDAFASLSAWLETN